jgi:hypothetical protein
MTINTQEELAYTIGVQAYIYGYPTMDLYRTFYENALDPNRGHNLTLGEFIHSRQLVTPEDKWVVTPNNDTLYCRAFLDLSAEPIILQIPATGDRPYWFPIGDIYHNLNASLSWDTVGGNGGAFALCPPGFEGLMPAGVERVDVRTPYIWMIGRYYVSGVDDVPSVNALQDQTHFIPFSRWGQVDVTRPQVNPADYPQFTQVDLQDAAKFYTVFNELLRRNPPIARDESNLNWFKEINLHPRQQFDWDSLDAATQAGLTRAVAAGYETISARTKSFARIVNGWVEVIVDADMGDQPVNHAGLCMMGLLYSQKEASTYHVAYSDGDLQTLDGNNKYQLHFDPPPPVEAFWSVTIYSAATRLYVANAIDRYAIGDRTPGIQFNDDDSFTITIQHDEPTDPKDRANWLPAPAEPFYLVLREYSSKFPILTRAWEPPAVKKVG